MTVYVDVILLANFLLDYNLIAYTGVINQQRVSFLRIILATLLALSSLSLFFVEIKSLFLLLRIIYSLVIILAIGFLVTVSLPKETSKSEQL